MAHAMQGASGPRIVLGFSAHRNKRLGPNDPRHERDDLLDTLGGTHRHQARLSFTISVSMGSSSDRSSVRRAASAS
jgi:hypothetical protein